MTPRRYKMVFTLLCALSLFSYAGILVFAAAPPAGGFVPGAELDPSCTPGSITPNPCIVKQAWQQDAANSFVYNTTDQIGLGTATPSASAVLDISSTTKGALLPRMTTVQRDAIASPATGLQIYNTDDNLFYYYSGAAWVAIANGTSLIGSTSTLGSETWLGTSAAGLGTASSSNTVFVGIDAGLNATSATFGNFMGFHAGAGATNANRAIFIGATAGLNAVDSQNSIFLGTSAGSGATTAPFSAFIGDLAGAGATGADHSNFFGLRAGQSATGANESNFIGDQAGNGATNASNANFIGNHAGYGAAGASEGVFIGDQAGASATLAATSIFVGQNAGSSAGNAANSIFIGQGAGGSDTVDNTAGGTSILIGADTGTGGNQNSIALGAGGVNNKTHQFLVAASYVNWQIAGVDYTWTTSQAGGSGYVLTNNGSGALNWTSPTATGLVQYDPTTNGIYTPSLGAGVRGSGGSGNNIAIGTNAGSGTGPGDNSTFYGYQAGFNSAASSVNFIGANAGNGATSATGGNFLGYAAGQDAASATYATFLGDHAGFSASLAAGSTFIGRNAGSNADNAAGSIFIGTNTGQNDTVDNTISGHSILIGDGASTGTSCGGIGCSNSIALGTNATNTMTNQFALGDSYVNLRLGGIEYVVPPTQGVAASYLKNDGSGNLSWYPLLAYSYTVGTDNMWVEVAGSGAHLISGGGQHNFITGYAAGAALSSGIANTFLGTRAGELADVGISNTYIGNNAGRTGTNASFNTFIGADAGANSTGNGNIGIGNLALYGLGVFGGGENIAMGNSAGRNVTSGSESIFIGNNAGYSVAPGPSVVSTANDVIFIGYRAGILSTGSSNIFMGSLAGNTNESGHDNVIIGTHGDVTANNYSNSIGLGSAVSITGSNQFVVGSTTSPIDRFYMVGSGGTSCALDANGTSCSSDQRLKTNITDLSTSTLDTLTKVRTVTYNWISGVDTNQHVGFLAQDIQHYFPQLVSTAPNGYLQVNYAGMTPILTESIRELNLKIGDIQNFATSLNTTFLDNLKNWLGSTTNGLVRVYADTLVSNEVDTKRVCVDGQCLTGQDVHDLLQLKNQMGGSTTTTVTSGGTPEVTPVPAPAPVPTPDTGSSGGTPPADTGTGSTPDSTPAPSPDVTPAPAPAPAPSPTPAPDAGVGQ